MEPAPLRRLLIPVLLVEGALAFLALLLGWWWLGDPLPVPLEPSTGDAWRAPLAAALAMLAAACLTSERLMRRRWLASIQRRVTDLLGEALVAETRVRLLWVSLAAGLGEELLFRGVLQVQLGLLVSALLFGLAHALTPGYFGLALAMGLLLGGLSAATGGLLLPVVVHASYDAVALLRLRGQLLAAGHGHRGGSWPALRPPGATPGEDTERAWSDTGVPDSQASSDPTAPGVTSE